MKTNVKNEILKVLNHIYDENFNLIQERLKPLNEKLKFRKAFEFKSSNKISMKSISNNGNSRMENSRFSILSKLMTEKKDKKEKKEKKIKFAQSKSAFTTSANGYSQEAKSEKIEMTSPKTDRTKRHSFYVNQKFPNTNLFILFSSINMIFNLPFVANVTVIFNPYIEKFTNVEDMSSENPYFFLYFVITEVFLVC